MIQVKDVSKVYGKGENTFAALDSVNFTIPDGSVVAIVGKSGSGKSTLMHVMSGLDTSTSGAVIVNGTPLGSMKQRELDRFRSREMSFIFQSFFVQGNESCYDNVSLPLEIGAWPSGKRKGMVQNALTAVELNDKLSQRAKNLSGGQKQRLAIARAIVSQPKILFADEPTGNLDSATGKVVEDLLFGYARDTGATLILVTHDSDLAAKCALQIHMKDGKVTEILKNGEATPKPSRAKAAQRSRS